MKSRSIWGNRLAKVGLLVAFVATASASGGGCGGNTNIETTSSMATGASSSGSGGGAGGNGAGGAGGNGGGKASDKGVPATETVSAGQVSTSVHYKMVHTFGQPAQNQGKTYSPGYRLQGGINGANGSLP